MSPIFLYSKMGELDEIISEVANNYKLLCLMHNITMKIKKQILSGYDTAKLPKKRQLLRFAFRRREEESPGRGDGDFYSNSG